MKRFVVRAVLALVLSASLVAPAVALPMQGAGPGGAAGLVQWLWSLVPASWGQAGQLALEAEAGRGGNPAATEVGAVADPDGSSQATEAGATPDPNGSSQATEAGATADPNGSL